MIYLDNAATTSVASEVLEAMLPFFTYEYGNAGSIYSFGKKASDAIEAARWQVANLIGALPHQIIFTSSGSEANNLAITGVMNDVKDVKPHVIISSVEHDSVDKTASRFTKIECRVGNNGIIDMEELDHLLYRIGHDTGVVSIMYVNNETGAINPVREIASLCEKYNVVFHTDCVQAAGCEPINVDEMQCDLLSLSSHKIHGPKGVGALYVRNRRLLSPIINGGVDQEFGLRGGTENVPGIVGFGRACELAEKEKMKETRARYLKAVFLTGLRDSGVEFCVNGGVESSSGKIVNVRFDGVDAETLVLLADSFGVCVSAGSACRSHESKPSKVLTAMGLTDDQARDSIRVSFSVDESEEDVRNGAIAIAKCVKILRGECL